MSILRALFRRFTARLSQPGTTTLDLDQLELRQWADLPAWHPRRDRTPC